MRFWNTSDTSERRSMLNSPEEFGEDVLEYNPARFIRPKAGEEGKAVEINPDIRHPANIAFGFGRRWVSFLPLIRLIPATYVNCRRYPDPQLYRACPGSDIAHSALWLTTACLLTVFEFEAPDIEKPSYIGADGMVDPRFDPGFVCHPKKFKCEFKVRSEEARALLGELGMNVQ